MLQSHSADAQLKRKHCSEESLPAETGEDKQRRMQMKSVRAGSQPLKTQHFFQEDLS